MKRSPVGLRVLGLLPLLALAACGASGPDEVRVGDGAPRSGSGQAITNVIQGMVDEANPTGTRIRIAPWSLARTGGRIGEAQQAQLFSDDPSVIAVVGHEGSRVTLLAAPVYRAAGMPLIVPTATARELRDAGPHVFMLAPTDDDIGAALGDHALDSLGADRIAVLYVADAYGTGVRDGLVHRLQARGTPLASEVPMSGRECVGDRRLAIDPILQALMVQTDPDLVILALPQFQTRCIIDVLLKARPGLNILTSDSFVPASERRPFTAAERDAVRYLVLWEPANDSLTRRFVERIRAVTGRDPEPGAALTLDAHLLVAAAVREGRTTRADVMGWLRTLGTSEHPPFEGVTGPIAFGAPRRLPLHIKRLSALPARSSPSAPR